MSDNTLRDKKEEIRRKKRKSKQRKEKVKQGLSIFSFIVYLVGILILATYLLSFLTNTRNSLFGYTARIVATGSMEPTIKVNSINIIKMCDIDEIKQGDIVCFNYSQDIIHRVVNKTVNEQGLEVVHTKGDANEFTDSIEVNSDMIVGKVVYIFNGASTFIDKYSIRPGELDGTTLSKDIILSCCVIGLVIWFISFLIDLGIMAYKTLSKRDRFNGLINMYLNDIDELVIYRDILQDLLDSTTKNEVETRCAYYGNKIAKVKAEAEILRLHSEIRSFKKNIKYCIYSNRLGVLLDREDKHAKENEMSIKDIIDYCGDFESELENKPTE